MCRSDVDAATLVCPFPSTKHRSGPKLPLALLEREALVSGCEEEKEEES